MNILQIFERASGQKINVNKSSAFFSNNSSQSLKRDMCQKLGFKEANDHSTYLGLPNIIGRNKSVLFKYIKDRLVARIQG